MLLNNDDGKPTTRLTIGNVFLSTANSEIENALDKLGVVRRSPIRFECLRDKNGGLTSFKSGRRFVFVDIPTTPLPSYTLLGKGKMFLFHQEQRSTETHRERAEAEIFQHPTQSQHDTDGNAEAEKPEVQDTVSTDNADSQSEVSSQIPVAIKDLIKARSKGSIDGFLSRRARSSSVGRKSPSARSSSRSKRGRTGDNLVQKEKSARLEGEVKSSGVIVDWFTNPENSTPKG